MLSRDLLLSVFALGSHSLIFRRVYAAVNGKDVSNYNLLTEYYDS